MNQKISVEDHIINSANFQETSDKKMLIISDLHFHPNIDKVLLLKLMKYIQNSQPDYIVMPGDILDTDDFLKDPSSKKIIDYFMRSISEVSPLIIIPGNHDIANFDTKSFFDRHYVYNEDSMNYLSSLNNINNIYFLNNEQLIINNIMFTGLNPKNETYFKYHDKKNNEIFIEDYIKCNFKVDKDTYNVLLCHNPLFLFDNDVRGSINDFSSYDLSISGHFHDGYMPKFLDKFFKDTNIGIFTLPMIAPYPGIECRGVHPFGRGYGLVSQGFRKFGTNTSFFNALDKISAHDVEMLTIQPEDDKSKENNPKTLVRKK